MTRVRSLSAGGAVLALAFALSGCGGEDTLTEAEFRTQADAICDDFEKKGDDLTAALGDSPDEEAVEAAFKKAADLLDEQSDQIGDLKAPESIADDVASMLESVREGADKIRDKGLDLMNTGEDPLEDATKKAKDLDLKSCGSDD